MALGNATISQSAVCNRQRILGKRACSIESTGITPQAYQVFSSSLLFPCVAEYIAASSWHFCVWYSRTFLLHQMTPLSLAHLSQTPRHTFSQPYARAVWILDAEPFLLSVHTFSVGCALSTLAGRWFLRTTTVGTDRGRQSLLTCRTHLMLFHQGQKLWTTCLTRLKKMHWMLLFYTLQCHLGRHAAVVAQVSLQNAFFPLNLELILAFIACTLTCLATECFLFMQAF